VSESSLGFTLAPSGSTCYDYTSINGENLKGLSFQVRKLKSMTLSIAMKAEFLDSLKLRVV
jgi:hypothetical protein